MTMSKMQLTDECFQALIEGKKKYELRLGNPIINKLSKGMDLYIVNKDNTKEGISASVKRICWFESFDDALEIVKPNEIFPYMENDDVIKYYEELTDIERISRYHVVLIRIKIHKS